MSKTMNQLASGLYKALTEADGRKTKPYDTKAKVVRIDGDTAWVKIPGGIDETPVQRTNNANVDDTVMVRLAGGRAWLLGNNTSPATDDAQANAATQLAEGAGNLADLAAKAAADAQESAGAAYSYADQARIAAEAADSNAEKAQKSADSAVYGLSIVEDVVGTIDWLNKHGVFIACTEESVIEGKSYFTLTGTVIESPIGNPYKNGYYELINGKYVLSTDTEVDIQKTYYTVTGSKVHNPSGNPSTIPYYAKEINEAVTQYINTHLALTDNGLSITDGSRNSILISSKEGEEGVVIYGPTGIVAKYGRDAIIGNPQGYHIEITTRDEIQQGRLSFKNVDTEIAYMTNDELYIPRVVVVNSMQIGNWFWDAISLRNHLTLKWGD